MARKKSEDAPAPGSPAWMATFSDLMNLLLCFFVLLFSMSSVDASKWEQVVASFQSSFSIFSGGASSIGDGMLISMGTSQLNNLDEYYSQMGQKSEKTDGEEYIDHTPADGNNEGKGDNAQGENQGEGEDSKNPGNKDDNKQPGSKDEDKNSGKTEEDSLEDLLAAANREQTEEILDNVSALSEKYFLSDYLDISMDPSGKYVEIIISGSVLFDSGKAEIKEEAIPIVSKIGDILSKYKDNMIDIIGHTDNVPMKSSKYDSNDILSSARAIAAANYLVEKKGIPVSSLSWTGRGEHDPIASNATAEGRAKNRRIEIRIYNDLNSDK